MQRISIKQAGDTYTCRCRRQGETLHRACLSLCVLLLAGTACNNTQRPESSDAQIEVTFDPSPPIVGAVNVTLTLADIDGKPIPGAEVHLEGNMNHAGMKPSFAELQEGEPGRYSGKLKFTMGGDWFVLVSAKTSDGIRLERKVDVPGVMSN